MHAVITNTAKYFKALNKYLTFYIVVSKVVVILVITILNTLFYIEIFIIIPGEVFQIPSILTSFSTFEATGLRNK